MVEPQAGSVRTLSPERREDILLRLRRIEGQVRGVQRMVDEGRDCREIIIQVAAIKSALASVSNQVLQCYARNCLSDDELARDQVIAELIELFQGVR
ncbi:MAG: metal-sensitive transcriptional regulator [Oscillochloridaceae bacterium]|nr:metal-sensitive transcriptional regulator [Chloroflexaceae bacterium]MDW8389162.1 metal-sensitive transcriptional regulator [Oscillochloridaceae bacterium]